MGADPLGLFEHVGRQGLLNELHALGLQPVDLPGGLFLAGPALIGIHANGLLRDAAHGFEGGLIRGQPHLHLQHGEVLSLLHLLARDLGRVDANGHVGLGGIGRIQAEVAIERHAQLLAGPVEEGQIHGGHGGPLARQAAVQLGDELVEMPGIRTGDEGRQIGQGLLAAQGALVVADNARTFAVACDAIPREAHVQGVAVGAGRHGGGPGMAQLQPLHFRGEGGHAPGRGAGCGPLSPQQGCARRGRGQSLEEFPSLHFSLRMATSSLVQVGSPSSETWTPGWSLGVSWMKVPWPRYIPVWVI